ncbi:MAG: sigma D regulator [Gammaproteobacteria bacterium]|nr:sigma D regulator [Gammaproteobacteria bacterium]
MTSTQSAPVERRTGSFEKLHTLLETRNATLTLFSQLAGMRPFNPDKEMQRTIQEFCEALVDYTASAHFQLYRFIEEDAERRTEVRKVAEKIYPEISASTRFILDFNEKYDCEDHCDNLANLEQDLSKLGEVLADRITLEDQIISSYSGQRA